MSSNAYNHRLTEYKHGTGSQWLPDPNQLTHLLESGYPVNKAVLPWCDTVLVMAARFHFLENVEKIIDCHGEVFQQDNLDAALMACLSTLKSPIVLTTVVLLLHHGATLCSALRLCRVLRAVGLHDPSEMKDVLLALVMASKDILVEGVVLNALCNAGIQMRVRLDLEVLSPSQVVDFLKELLILGVRSEAFWTDGLHDQCLQGEESRQFKLSEITIAFIQASHQNDPLQKILESSTIFTKPCDNALDYLRMLGQAGHFSEPG
ncbi:hypothetical protein CAPTEDRAFT_201666 [Capitella teleta]|uniref:Uncharacterized protein n=1 Tax=Capitella teleta TaxID=283909 RepID=R7V170_CAPTE|nr:hypothetical protein CAPTEDRAFT_201666 [Capitella teleta]|eukprot:ELU12593.1 hypothetical protein CAPTEDRAFT_201666 [Capitella teleta]